MHLHRPQFGRLHLFMVAIWIFSSNLARVSNHFKFAGCLLLLMIVLYIYIKCHRKIIKKMEEGHAKVYGFLRVWYIYELRKFSRYVIFTNPIMNTSYWILVHYARSHLTKRESFLRSYTANVRIYRLLQDSCRIFILLTELSLFNL